MLSNPNPKHEIEIVSVFLILTLVFTGVFFPVNDIFGQATAPSTNSGSVPCTQADSCGTIIPAPTPYCTDSDGGNYTYAKGLLTYKTDTGATTSVEDFCRVESGNNLVEYYCLKDTKASEDIYCEYGCNNGACNQCIQGTCNDRLGGLKQQYCSQGSWNDCPTNTLCKSGSCVLNVANLCGNFNIDAGEDCDSTNLNGKSCQSLQYTGGTLSCKPTCKFDLSSCTSATMPDIQVSEIIVSATSNTPIDAGQPITGPVFLYAKVKNSGTESISTDKIQIKADRDGIAINPWDIPLCNAYPNTVLAPGQEMICAPPSLVSGLEVPDGAHTINIDSDLSNNTVEINESNNNKSTTRYFIMRKPDLSVGNKLYIKSTDPIGVPGYKYIGVNVTNIGNNNSRSFYVMLTFKNSYGNTVLVKEFICSALVIGESEICDYRVNMLAGDYAISAVVDSRRQVDESSKTNNEANFSARFANFDCIDTDLGNTPNIYGRVMINNSLTKPYTLFNDTCNSINSLTEYTCGAQYNDQIAINDRCTNYCINGKCTATAPDLIISNAKLTQTKDEQAPDAGKTLLRYTYYYPYVTVKNIGSDAVTGNFLLSFSYNNGSRIVKGYLNCPYGNILPGNAITCTTYNYIGIITNTAGQLKLSLNVDSADVIAEINETNNAFVTTRTVI